ncbi:hypothetical protein B484DRAFT_443667 [Ochromonadaceae sp. CCMP2298]|nr:hypothetical protein B484DRAFT_443667 [Ochromonadaceae sp. CCMP2298]|eukprot:CAMPEP_0173169194 /NCGR_PEP_ID=MMETSP1141-20130122/566_1 /TAXON_ID=483371 /ORGANISM="non described non described, Strain CCMP2298" /LENGTH=1314 /DNA_ID=CAMNT_0014090989 /DNA_START=154 /DNA_END=4098 /DNA_ORIENTATION=-
MKLIAIAVAQFLLWRAVSASLDVSDFLFKADFFDEKVGVDQQVVDHATMVTEDGGHRRTQSESVWTNATDSFGCHIPFDNTLFDQLTFKDGQYTTYYGLDTTALLGGSTSMTDDLRVIGSPGYDIFRGIVHIYKPFSVDKWSLQALIRSPDYSQSNFGSDVWVDRFGAGERLAVSAPGHEKYDGKVYVYENTGNDWFITGTIWSPYATVRVRGRRDQDFKRAQGFGYRVALGGKWLIASTAENSAYMFEEVKPGKWVLHTDLTVPCHVTGEPTSQPSSNPSSQPTSQPSANSTFPHDPTGQPSSQPSAQPSTPTGQPSSQPSAQPSSQPSGRPSSQPSSQPSGQPTSQPSANPTGEPTGQPSFNPSGQPSSQPTSQPSPFELQHILACNDSYYGRSLSISFPYAVVGAYGYNGSQGRVYVFDYNKATDKWQHFQTIEAEREFSNFGFDVDIHRGTIVVGANGYRVDRSGNVLFENKAEFWGWQRSPVVQNNSGWFYTYVYDATRNQFMYEQEVPSPVGNNSYFGSSVSIVGDAIAVGADGYPCGLQVGAGFVYHRIEVENASDASSGRRLQAETPTTWQINASYPSPGGSKGHFGFSSAISENYVVFAAAEFVDLRGAVFLAKRPVPNDVPTPTMAPTKAGEALGGGGLKQRVPGTGLSLGMILALILAGLIVGMVTGMIIYCCCCMIPVIPLIKKKKKEEEESPYTVHSYAGYIEEDDEILPPPPVIYIEEEEEMEKKKDDKKEKKVEFMEDGKLRQMFPYKVHGPRGYVEDTNEVDEILEKSKMDSAVRDEEMEGMYEMDGIYEKEEDFEYSRSIPRPDSPPRLLVEERRQSEHSESSMSMVEQARMRLRTYRQETVQSERVESTNQVRVTQSYQDEASDDTPVSLADSNATSLVEQARHRFRSYRQEAGSVEEQSEVREVRTTSQLVEQARMRFQSYRTEAGAEVSTQEQVAVSDVHDDVSAVSSGGSSLVEQARMRFRSYRTEAGAEVATQQDDASVSSNNSSLVEQARERFRSYRTAETAVQSQEARTSSVVRTSSVEQTRTSSTSEGQAHTTFRSFRQEKAGEKEGGSAKQQVQADVEDDDSVSPDRGLLVEQARMRLQSYRQLSVAGAGADEDEEDVSLKERREVKRTVSVREEEEEDDRVERAVQQARARSEQTELEARAAAIAEAERQKQLALAREEARASALAKAQEKFAEFKARAEQESREKAISAAAMEEARVQMVAAQMEESRVPNAVTPLPSVAAADAVAKALARAVARTSRTTVTQSSVQSTRTQSAHTVQAQTSVQSQSSGTVRTSGAALEDSDKKED